MRMKREQRGRESVKRSCGAQGERKKSSPPIETAREQKISALPPHTTSIRFKERRRRPFSLFLPFFSRQPTSARPRLLLRGSHIAIAVMSTAKPATAAAGDVELAKSRLVTGVDPPSTPAGEGSSLAGTRGASSSVRFRLSSLWSEMFHDAPGGMVRIAWKGRSGIGPEFLLFFVFQWLCISSATGSNGLDRQGPLCTSARQSAN